MSIEQTLETGPVGLDVLDEFSGARIRLGHQELMQAARDLGVSERSVALMEATRRRFDAESADWELDTDTTSIDEAVDGWVAEAGQPGFEEKEREHAAQLLAIKLRRAVFGKSTDYPADVVEYAEAQEIAWPAAPFSRAMLWMVANGLDDKVAPQLTSQVWRSMCDWMTEGFGKELAKGQAVAKSAMVYDGAVDFEMARQVAQARYLRLKNPMQGVMIEAHAKMAERLRAEGATAADAEAALAAYMADVARGLTRTNTTRPTEAAMIEAGLQSFEETVGYRDFEIANEEFAAAAERRLLTEFGPAQIGERFAAFEAAIDEHFYSERGQYETQPHGSIRFAPQSMPNEGPRIGTRREPGVSLLRVPVIETKGNNRTHPIRIADFIKGFGRAANENWPGIAETLGFCDPVIASLARVACRELRNVSDESSPAIAYDPLRVVRVLGSIFMPPSDSLVGRKGLLARAGADEETEPTLLSHCIEEVNLLEACVRRGLMQFATDERDLVVAVVRPQGVTTD